MAEIAAKDLKVHRRVLPRDEAIEHFKQIGEHYKAEIIARDSGGRADQPLRAGRLGGPVPRAARAEHRQAQGVQAHEGGRRLLARRFAQRDAAADLWHRLANEKQLKEYLTRLEEAEKRDHRRIGKELDLFHLQEEAPGAVFWHPKGWALFQQLIGYMRERQNEAGYSGGEHAGDHGSRAVGEVGSHREFRREHVHDRDAR